MGGKEEGKGNNVGYECKITLFSYFSYNERCLFVNTCNIIFSTKNIWKLYLHIDTFHCVEILMSLQSCKKQEPVLPN